MGTTISFKEDSLWNVSEYGKPQHHGLNMKNNKAVILLSGGLDSTTNLAIAASESFDLYCMTFYYGQRHDCELTASKEVALNFHAREHKLIKIDLRQFGGSALTDEIDVPDYNQNETSIPVTYVPARNTIFLSYALAWAEVLESKDIFIGVNAVDYSGYPDCRPEYIEAFQKMANLATKTAVNGAKVTIHTPLIDLTKAEIIKRGVSLGVDYSKTHSCYNPDKSGLACGICDSCVLRKKGFDDAEIPDPTKYFSR